MIDRLLMVAGIVATLIVTGATAVDMELTRARGDQIYLKLAPVDPRSMIQGDFMRLRYDVGREASRAMGDAPDDGTLIVALDGDNVASFASFEDGRGLANGEHRLAYRVRDGRVDVGTNSWMFQEGTADVWNQAKYGEFRVLPTGRAVLVGLRDAQLQELGEPLRAW